MPTDLSPVDDRLTAILEDERERQRDTLSLIASENYASEAVLRTQGSVLTNTYAEGKPGNRYYAGCEHADEVEELAVERAKELFGAEHVNVQPHSGTGANLAAYQTLLEPGDAVLSLDLTHGGHLSHGQPYTLVDDHFDVHHYGVDPETGRLDYDAVEQRTRDVEPDLVVSGYSAYPRQVDWERMQAVADSVDAYHVADIAHLTGLVAGGVHPSPVGVADLVTCSTHKSIRSGRGGMVMCGADLADDVDRAVMPGTQGGPLMHNVAGKAAGFHEALRPGFDDYAQQIVENATVLGDRLREGGFELVSGGTDVHFVLADFRETHPDLTGVAAEDALADVGLVTNKSTVPGDPRSSTVTSGLRIGTPAVRPGGSTPTRPSGWPTASPTCWTRPRTKTSATTHGTSSTNCVRRFRCTRYRVSRRRTGENDRVSRLDEGARLKRWTERHRDRGKGVVRKSSTLSHHENLCLSDDMQRTEFSLPGRSGYLLPEIRCS